MITLNPNKILYRLLFFVFLTSNLCFSELVTAKNTHDAILDQSITNSQLAKVPFQKKGRQQDKKAIHHAPSRPIFQKPTGPVSVQTDKLKIDSHNTITRSVDSRNGANIAIGDTDISNTQLNSATIETENKIYGGVKARGDEVRYRMGTVDVEGIHGSNLGVSTRNTVRGDVSVGNGQDVAIGVIEMGNPKKDKKNQALMNRQRTEDNPVDFMKIGQYGHSITLPKVPDNNTEDDINGVCEEGRICSEIDVCCQRTTIDKSCHVIDGCSTVRDTWLEDLKNKENTYIFGVVGGDFTEDGRHIPCNSHDQCYQTCGTDQKACDIQMYYDMIDVCRSHKKEIKDWNEKDILMPDDVWNKFHTGGAAMLAPTVALVTTKQPEVARRVSIITNAVYSEEIDQTKKTLLLAVPAIIEPNATKWSNRITENNNLKNQIVEDVKNQLNEQKNIGKKLINTATENSIFLVNDVANMVEDAGKGINIIFDQAATVIGPDKSFVDSVFQPPTNTCNATGSFWKSMTCDIGQTANQIASASTWSVKKVGSLFVEGLGEVANHTGQLLATDVRFSGILGATSLEYAGYSALEIGHYANQASVDTFDLINDFDAALLSFSLDQVNKGARYAGDLIFDCLTAAETYYTGLRYAGRFFFRGKKEQCPNNKIDEGCCVVNPKYAYHRQSGIEATMGDIPIPFQKFCREKARN